MANAFFTKDYFTIDGVISALTKIKNELGNCMVFISDPNTPNGVDIVHSVLGVEARFRKNQPENVPEKIPFVLITNATKDDIESARNQNKGDTE